MIIKKSQFNYNRKLRGSWPFTVPEVAVVVLNRDNTEYYAVVHDYNLYAMSGNLKQFGLATLDQSGIWRRNASGDGFVSLMPFHDFLVEQVSEFKQRLTSTGPN